MQWRALSLACALALAACGNAEGPVAASAAASSAPLAPAASATAAVPTQFQDVVQLFEELNDFPPDTGEFVLVNRSPLAIKLGPMVAEKDDPELIKGAVALAAVYGVYRTLIHTPARSVKVTVRPLVVKNKKRVPLQGYDQEVAVTREQAEKIAAKYGFAPMTKMVGERDMWTAEAKAFRYDNNFSGSFKILADLKK